MREIFFTKENWELTGDGDFTGTFHLFKGGHDLTGTFTSAVAGVNDYRFPQLYGSLHWTPKAFEVTNAGSKLFGGDARFAFSIKPLGSPGGRPRASRRRTRTSISPQLSDFYELPGHALRADARRARTCSSGRSAGFTSTRRAAT